MSSYLLVESRDPVAVGDVANTFDLANDLSVSHEVTIFLTQNAVLGARASVPTSAALLARAGKAAVIADDFCLAERGLGATDLASGVRAAGIDAVVDLAVDQGHTVIWS